MQKKISLIIFLIFLFLFIGCAKHVYERMYPTLHDGKYDTEFPYKNCSKELEKISETTKQIIVNHYYKHYLFSKESQITKSKFKDINPDKMAIQKKSFVDPSSGTATIIHISGNNIALITCAHILNHPDTVVFYYNPEDEESKQIIRSIAVKTNQTLYISDIPNSQDFNIIKMDTNRDIAIIGRDFGSSGTLLEQLSYSIEDSYRHLKVFDYPPGNSRELEWGSFVYILGYPIGKKMITRGIVSDPKNDRKGDFLIDALFNQGFSGGVVLAIRDGVPHFELVGLAKSVSTETNSVLTPLQSDESIIYDPNVPFQGDAYVTLRRDINYGVTHSISIESIKEFFKENEVYFKQLGYRFKQFSR